MAIDSVPQVFREIPAASAVPQLSLTKRDRELQMQEGRPPMEVASTEQEALRWHKREDPQEKWKRRPALRKASRLDEHVEPPADNPEESIDESLDQDIDQETAYVVHPRPVPEIAESSEEESTGTLFDDRS